MTYAVPRSLAQAFYEAYAVRDADRIAAFLHDDVEWTVSGPVDYLPFCGVHRGKASVVDLIRRRIPTVLRTYSFVAEVILVDGDQVAMLSRQSSRRAADDQVISYRVANHLRFRDGKVIKNLSLIDSFDAVEQLLGQQLAVGGGVRAGDDRLVAV